MIPGLPAAESAAVLTLLKQQQVIEQVLLYGSRAMGRNHSGSDVDLCLVAPSLNLEDMLPQGHVWMICCCPQGLTSSFNAGLITQPARAHRAGWGGLAIEASAQNRKVRPLLTRQDIPRSPPQ